MNKTKVCKKCGEEKDITLFCKSKKCKDGYTNRCKECKKKYDRQHRKENEEKIKEKKKQYYQENRDKILKRVKKYYRENPHVSFNANNRRRSKIEQQGKGINGQQWFEMMKFFDFKCAYSDIYIGGDNKDRNRTIDHILCLDNGGLNEIWNVVPMYSSYNFSKKTNNPMEWYLKQDFYSEDRLNKIIEWQIYAYEKYATEDDEDLILIVDII